MFPSSSTIGSSGSVRAPTCCGREAGTWSTSGLKRAGDRNSAACRAMPRGRVRDGRSAGDADRLAVDHLVEVLRQPEADLAVATPLGHALRDARHEHVAVGRLTTVPQRDERQDAALDLVVAVGGVRDRVHVLVVRVGAAPLGLELDLVDRAVLADLEHDPTDALAAFPRGDDRDDEPEVLAEVGGQPPVPPPRLPVARPPGVVAEPETVDLP